MSFDAEIPAISEKTGACGCCGLNIAAADHGVVMIVFRSASEMVNRDIHLLVSKDFGRTFQVAAVDPWRVGMCVMSTASIAAHGPEAIAAWETRGQIHVEKFNPGTGDVPSPITVPGLSNDRKHPSVTFDTNGNYLVAWAEGTGWNKGGSIAWQVFDSTGNPIPRQSGRADGLPIWGIPAVFATRDDTFTIVY